MLAAWSFMSWTHALSPCPLPVEGGSPILPLTAYLTISRRFIFCAPLHHYALLTTHSVRTAFPGYWPLVTFLSPSY